MRYARGVHGFIPVERPRLAVALDGTLAAIAEPARVTLVTLPAAAPFAVVTGDHLDVAWLGAPPLLLVIARHGTHATARLVDPDGARVAGACRLEAGATLRACVDRFAFVTGPSASTILVAEPARLVAHPLPRVPAAIGAAGARFVLATDDAIEEWDPAELAIKRRWRPPTGAAPAAVGASPHSLWWTTRATPHRLDVIPLVQNQQPTVHALPEPIADIACHPAYDVLACVGAESRHVHVVTLDRAAAPWLAATASVARADAIAFVGGFEAPRVLVAEIGRPVATVSLAPPPPPAWRDELAAWTRSGGVDRVPAVAAIEDLARSLGVPDELAPAVTLCYGAHLCGTGVAPAAIAGLLGRWDEALGAGRLAASGVLVFADSRVALAPAIARTLDAL